MRKIEQAMIRALRAGKDWTSGNTSVSSGSTDYVHLHGHLIARRINGSVWEFNLCGWNTSTTRSRINAIAREYGEPIVTTRGTWGPGYDDGKGQFVSVPTEGWF